ncbi:PREDICTED: bumetanide-sensitive sodium-(potassium)-chloride cotransporter-like [Diuraphis noxia]|uniref:bumetanide-sensitive sodium-(potassium)-chloride cotransporter-like n=1 Tax=Diuraphis noxia TaxID=143948 RepID=UPI0007635966|nr:PREDICTED: bumetanide-sensitive sodium-(potassium)-chloride cotransporter-like [Diuraphis noxia]
MSEHDEIKNKSRPWIDQIQSYNDLYREEENKIELSPGIKLGWVKGVLIPCLLSIWGVMLFLRMPWILAQAGIFHSIIIIFISLLIILITTFSLSAISTNGKVKGGGLYFIISRSIGPEFGASIGILLALANTISAAMNAIGFCVSLRSLLQSRHISIIDSNVRFKALGVVSIIIMSILCCIGMDREAEVQNALLIAIIIGIFNVIIGSYNGPKSTLAKASGFTGFDMKTFKENWYSDYRVDNNVQQSFFSIFAVFFPSVTGIQAGANISGDLKDPSDSIPKGTLLSIIISIISYIVLIVVPGSVQLREASGNENEFQDGYFSNCSFRNCTKGLYKDINVYQSISLWPITIYFGCFGATISTALTALISVPKLLQRMGQDDVYPLLKYLAKGYGKSNEPYRAHIFAMIVSSIIVIIGELNDIASVISTIYLSAYALLNLCTFHVEYFKPLGWRPTYKFYNKWLSLAVAIICISVMIFIDSQMSLIIGSAICVLYILAGRKKEVLNWGSSMQTQQIKTVIKNVYKADTIQYHIKNYLPNLIVFSGNPESRKKLVSLAHLITKNNGVQMCVNIEKISITPRQKQICLDKGIQWLRKSGIKSLYVIIDNIELDLATYLIYSCGHGQLRPNIVMVGYKSDWLNCPYQDLQTYLNIFNVANMNNMSTIMVRVPSTEIHDDQNLLIQDFKHLNKNEEVPCKTQLDKNMRNQQKVNDCFVVNMKNKEFSFEKKKRNHGTVDVWWLYNDGGLSLIIAFILKHSTAWKNCKFRIFGVTNKVECLPEEKNKLKQLLSLYRINFDYLDIILSSTAGPTTMIYFSSLLKRATSKENQFEDFNLQKEYIAETLFLRDLIELHSFNSDLIILTTPKNNEEINLLFMCWIETISRGLPPCIIINGSTQSVLAVNA